MEGKNYNGSDGFNFWNDGDAADKPNPSAFGTQEVSELKDEQYTDFTQSNRRYDNYHLNFSSKL